MRYKLIKDDMNPDNLAKFYYVMDDNVNDVFYVINENCEQCSPPPAHSIIDENPPLPPCLQNNQP